MKIYHLADYATYKILVGLDPNSEGYTPKSRYYKAIYLLNYKLLKRKINICLPWRWYIYGPIVELDCIDKSVYKLDPQTGPLENEFKSKLMFGDEPKPEAPREVITAVDYEIKQICDAHPGVMELVDLSYETAELPFIKNLKKYDDTISSNFTVFPTDPRVLYRCENLRNELTKHYPLKKYGEMHGASLRILELIRKVKDQHMNELLNTINCSYKIRWGLARGFRRDFHGVPPDKKIDYILNDYESSITTLDDFAFHKEYEFFNAKPEKEMDYYHAELNRIFNSTP